MEIFDPNLPAVACILGYNSIADTGGLGAESKTLGQQPYNLEIYYFGWSFAGFGVRRLLTSRFFLDCILFEN